MLTYVEHVVLLKTRRSPTPEERKRFEALASLPGVVSVTQGDDYSGRGQGFNYCVVMRFTSKFSQEAFKRSPEHALLVKEVTEPLIDPETKPIVLDYEHQVRPRLGLLAFGFAAGMLAGMVYCRRK